MQKVFKKAVHQFQLLAYQFSVNSDKLKWQSLNELKNIKMTCDREILTYHQALLFTLTHPENEAIFTLAENELNRMAAFLKKSNHANHPAFSDSGLPFTKFVTCFTQDAFNTLLQYADLDIEIESLNNKEFDLNAFLNITLPGILKEETTAGLQNDDLLKVLGVNPKKSFNFLLQQINQLHITPLAKDHLWQNLQSFFTIKGKTKFFSKSFNRLQNQPVFYTKQLVKKFDHAALLQEKLKPEIQISRETRNEIVAVIQNSMPLAMREIDTATYMNPDSLRYFELDRGLTIALFGMYPERQLPLQSFVGFTLFKNSFPISYGGSWIFGECAMLGFNVLDEFRGGESKYIMIQVLRAYVQTFKLRFYEVEPFQFGNHEAIETGAFWVYYKFGFRPVDKQLKELAKKEQSKIDKNPAYRTSHKILTDLAGSNLSILLFGKMPVHRTQIIKKITHLISHTYKADSFKAIQDAKKFMREQTLVAPFLTEQEEVFFEEVALWVYAFRITNPEKLKLFSQMIHTKGQDYLKYNNLLQQVLAQ